MNKISRPEGFSFYGNNNAEGQNAYLVLARAIEEVENFFLREKEGKLYKFLLNVFDKPVIESVLEKTEGNQLKASRILGINRNTLHAKIKKLKINVEEFKRGG